jgi:type III secretory pathway component EscS
MLFVHTLKHYIPIVRADFIVALQALKPDDQKFVFYVKLLIVCWTLAYSQRAL